MVKNAYDSRDYDDYTLETLDTAQGDRLDASCHIDLRRSPRVDTWFKAQMISDYSSVEGHISNLSRSGLCFEAGGELPELLISASGLRAGKASGVVVISFDVPIQNAESKPVIAQARTVYVIDGDGGNYRCGAEFIVFAEGEKAFEDYLRARTVAK